MTRAQVQRKVFRAFFQGVDDPRLWGPLVDIVIDLEKRFPEALERIHNVENAVLALKASPAWRYLNQGDFGNDRLRRIFAGALAGSTDEVFLTLIPRLTMVIPEGFGGGSRTIRFTEDAVRKKLGDRKTLYKWLKKKKLDGIVRVFEQAILGERYTEPPPENVLPRVEDLPEDHPFRKLAVRFGIVGGDIDTGLVLAVASAIPGLREPALVLAGLYELFTSANEKKWTKQFAERLRIEAPKWFDDLKKVVSIFPKAPKASPEERQAVLNRAFLYSPFGVRNDRLENFLGLPSMVLMYALEGGKDLKPPEVSTGDPEGEDEVSEATEATDEDLASIPEPKDNEGLKAAMIALPGLLQVLGVI